MCRSTMWALKALILGLMVGLVAGTFGSCYFHHHRRGVKRHIGRALRNMGALADNVVGMF
ncbi:MAG: hypothetical protein J6K98_00180 [Clostridia bacterium]|nr:hypothetical protein [Clostridia bacterium]